MVITLKRTRLFGTDEPAQGTSYWRVGKAFLNCIIALGEIGSSPNQNRPAGQSGHPADGSGRLLCATALAARWHSQPGRTCRTCWTLRPGGSPFALGACRSCRSRWALLALYPPQPETREQEITDHEAQPTNSHLCLPCCQPGAPTLIQSTANQDRLSGTSQPGCGLMAIMSALC